jgi:hypothetical protein
MDASRVLSTEAISYQKQSLFYQDLIKLFELAKLEPRPMKATLEKLGLNDTVKKHTGLKVNVIVSHDVIGAYNAFASPPIIDLNNPFYNVFKDWGYTDNLESWQQSKMQLEKLQKNLTSKIDRKRSRVEGLFAEITTDVGIGVMLLKHSPAEEIAAIFLHELGHVFTYFEILTDTVSVNMAVSAASQALNLAQDETEKLQIIYDVGSLTNTRFKTPKEIAQVHMTVDGYSAILIREVSENATRSATNSRTYDLRNMEFSADHFATMHGAGRALVSGLERLDREFGHNHRVSTAQWFIVEASKVAFTVLSALLVVPFIPVCFYITITMCSSLEDNIYDLPTERLRRARSNLVQAMKDLSLESSDRRRILEDIEFIDNLTKDMIDRRTLLNLIWISLTPNRRKQHNQIKFQKELESLINNDLFVSAGKLTLMSSNGA